MNKNDIFNPEIPSKIIGYGRVSTDEQKKNYSLEGMSKAFEERKKRYNWIGEKMYEEAETGTSLAERPIIREILDRIRREKFDGIWVYQQDRLVRPTDWFDVAEIAEILVSTDTILIVCDTPYDLSNPENTVFFDFDALMSKYNRVRLLSNMRRGKRTKAQRGENAGGRASYGFEINKDTKKYTPAEVAGRCSLVWQLADEQNMSLRKIREEMYRRGIPSPNGKRLWSVSQLNDMLHNEKYLGIYHYGKTRVIKGKQTKKKTRIRIPKEEWIRVGSIENPNHKPIVTAERFYRVLEKLERRRKKVENIAHLLTGIGRCHICKDSFVIAHSGGKHNPCYICRNKKKKPNKCTSPWLRMHDMNEWVWNKFKLVLLRPFLIRKLVLPEAEVKEKITEWKNQIDKNEKSIIFNEDKKEHLVKLCLDGRINDAELSKMRTDLDKEITALKIDNEKYVDLVRREENKKGEIDEIIKYYKILRYSDKKLTYRDKIRIFHALVYKVNFFPSQAENTYRGLDFNIELYHKDLAEDNGLPYFDPIKTHSRGHSIDSLWLAKTCSAHLEDTIISPA